MNVEFHVGRCRRTLRRWLASTNVRALAVNAIPRAGALGLAVLCAAATTACEVEVSTAGVSQASMAFDPEGTRPTEVFAPGDPFYVAGELAHAPAGTRLRATWVAVSVEAEGVTPNLVLESTEVTGGSGPFHFELTNDTPWPLGHYRVELAVDDAAEKTLEFDVGVAESVVSRADDAPDAHNADVVAPRAVRTSFGGSDQPSGSRSAARPAPDTVLAEQGGHVFRQAHLDQGLEMIRFLSGEAVGAREESRLREDALRQFHDDPEEFAQGMAFIDQVLTAARSTADVFQIAGYRMLLFNTLYAANQQLPADERPALLEIVFEKNPVLAFDPLSQLVLTERDVRAAVEMAAFGAGSQLTESQVRGQAAVLAHDLAPRFAGLPLAEQQVLASAGVLWEIVDSNLSRFSAEQRTALRSGYAAGASPQASTMSWSQQTSGSAGGLEPATAQFLSRLSLEQHVSTLNVIENIGGTGDYWELRPAW